MSESGRREDADEARIFYARVETYMGVKDHLRQGRCVRFVAVSPGDFQALSEDGARDGVDTFVVDIDFWDFVAAEQAVRHPGKPPAYLWPNVKFGGRQVERREDRLGIEPAWFMLTLAIQTRGTSYFYKTFSTDVPTRVMLVDMVHVAGPSTVFTHVQGTAVASGQVGAAASAQLFDASPQSPFHLDAFHVGQGMCALVHNKCQGVLLDAGAAKPITRARYLDPACGMVNELITMTERLNTLHMVLSHTDLDHLRLLCWDPDLLDQVQSILLPQDADALLIKDKAVAGKCRPTPSITLTLDKQACARLELVHSQPAKPDTNGTCLVTVFHDARGAQVLAPGDYVYARMATDQGGPPMNTMPGRAYHAVVVPHHGDEASAANVPAPAIVKGGQAKAFFSAGTYQNYQHPTSNSLLAHRQQGFQLVSNPACADILAVRLL